MPLPCKELLVVGLTQSHFVSNLQGCGGSQFPFLKSWCHFHATRFH